MWKIIGAIFMHASITSFGFCTVVREAASFALGVVSGAIGIILFILGLFLDRKKVAA